MNKIRVKNFGPIKEGRLDNEGWVEIKKTTVFIGDQASGKSTMAKLISTFIWLEKALYRGDIEDISIDDFKGDYCSYHRLFDFFKPNTEISFEGDYYTFTCVDNQFSFYPFDTKRQILVPKIMYVPAERNFLSTVNDAGEVKGLPRPLFTFQDEFERSLNEINGILDLPITKLKLEYDRSFKISYILGEDYKIKLLDASSGLHSLVPLFIVTRNLAIAVANTEKNPSKSELSVRQEQRKRAQLRDLNISAIQNELSDEEIEQSIKFIESKYVNSCFINIVEEPEQNLYPISQRTMLNSLLEHNKASGNILVITTHSPYLINYLTLSVEAYSLLEKINNSDNVDFLVSEVEEIVPLNATVNPDDLAIYELNELNGTIELLQNYDGIPSDENKLNYELGQGNDLFVDLLEIENKIK